MHTLLPPTAQAATSVLGRQLGPHQWKMQLKDGSFNASSVLIVHADRAFSSRVAESLVGSGYHIQLAQSGMDGYTLASLYPWRAVILDATLSDVPTLDVLCNIRHVSDVPVLLPHTSRCGYDEVAGLEAGASACLPDHAPLRELLARFLSMLRRTSDTIAVDQRAGSNDEIVIDSLCIAPKTRTASLADQDLELTPREFDVLFSLAKARGRVKTRQQIQTETSNSAYGAFDRSLDVQISSLRRKLRDDPKQPRFIHTVYSIGYMLTGSQPTIYSNI